MKESSVSAKPCEQDEGDLKGSHVKVQCRFNYFKDSIRRGVLRSCRRFDGSRLLVGLGIA